VLFDREEYEKVAGEAFDGEGFRWSGRTPCVLALVALA